MQKVYISGVGMTKFGKLKESLADLMTLSSKEALANAGLEKVDAIYVGSMNPEEFASESNIASVLSDKLGLVPVPATRVETASSSGAAAFDEAFYAVASGYFNNVLAVAGEKMTSVSTAKASKILAEVIAPEERKYGTTMPALAAMITRAYMRDFGMKEIDLAEVAVKNHLNGLNHPLGQFNKQITIDDVMNSKYIAEPLKLYDCSPISDGAASVILTTTPQKVILKGIGHGSEHVALTMRESFTTFKSTKIAAQKAYAMAGITPADISFAELHDAFTSFEIIGSEDVGFFEEGKGWLALINGITQRDGRLPINPSGGLKARGHPVGASGLAQIVEAVWQLRGEAKDRQIKNLPRYALTQSIGGLATNNMVIILKGYR